jgi:hypothetical protein
MSVNQQGDDEREEEKCCLSLSLSCPLPFLSLEPMVDQESDGSSTLPFRLTSARRVSSVSKKRRRKTNDYLDTVGHVLPLRICLYVYTIN